LKRRLMMILLTGLCLFGFSRAALAEGEEGIGRLTVYADPVAHATVTVYLQKDGTEDIGVEISNEGITETELAYGSYRIYREIGVEYPEGYELLEDIPLTYTIQASYPEGGEFVLDAEHPRASIGTRRSYARFYFTYSENAATTGVLTEQLVSANLLMEDARLQPILSPKDEAERMETFPTLGEKYEESMKAEIESVCESEGIEPPNDELINPDGSYGPNPFGLTEPETLAAETEPVTTEDVSLPGTAEQTQETAEAGNGGGDVALLIKVSVICLCVLLLTAILVILKKRAERHERR